MSVRRYYYWIVTQDNGRPFLVFGGDDEESARRKGLELLGGLDFEIRRYPTRDLNRARAFLAGKRLESGMRPSESTRRQGHEKSLARLRKRMLRRQGLG